MNPDFIVLAAGNGKRMLGSSPKVLLPIGGKPMAQHILDTISGIEKSRPILVVGDQAKEVKNSLQFKRNTKIVTQRKQLGTAHAVKDCPSPAKTELCDGGLVWRRTLDRR